MSRLNTKSFKVATTLAAQRIVGITAADTVGYGAATQFPVGVTGDTVKDTNGAIPVIGVGEIAKVFFNDTVSAGGLVTSDASGRAVPFTAVTAATYHVGVLVGAAISATGTIADILIAPGASSAG